MKKALSLILVSLLLNQISVYSQSETINKYEKEIKENISKGSVAYLKEDYKKAIKYYSKALELDNKQAILNKTAWRVVVDNLGMSYGISGNTIKAKEMFEFGISKDSKYPMFYYNLACAYAELNDLVNSIINLKLAFEYKENMISGEKMPDPNKDSSFSKYLNNDKFQNALKEIDNQTLNSPPL